MRTKFFCFPTHEWVAKQQPEYSLCLHISFRFCKKHYRLHEWVVKQLSVLHYPLSNEVAKGIKKDKAVIAVSVSDTK